MARIVRHRDSDNKALYQFDLLLNDLDDANRVVFLSDRDYSIIAIALSSIEKMQTRVIKSALPNDLFEIVSDEEFEQFQEWVSNLRTNLGGYIMANEYLERIAVALESFLALEDSRNVNLSDVLEVLELEPSEEVADWIEALQYFIGLFPSLNLSIPIPTLFNFDLGLFRYRQSTLMLLRDIAFSQRGQATAQGGIDFAALYDTLGETAENAIKPAGVAGVAYSIWRWIENDQLPGWTGWVTTISGLLLGSIRGATYDIAEAIGDLGGAEHPITINQDCCDPITVNPDGGTGGTGSTPSSPEPPLPIGTGTYPVDFPDFPTFIDHKCGAAQQLVSNLLVDMGKVGSSNLNFGQTILFAVATMTQWLRTPLSYDSLINLAALLVFTSNLKDYVGDMVAEIGTTFEDGICALYSATSPEDSRSAFLAYTDNLVDGMGLNATYTTALKEFMTYLVSQDAVNRLYINNPAFVDAGADCSECENILPIVKTFNETNDTEGMVYEDITNPDDVSGQWLTQQLRITIINDGSASRAGRWVYYPLSGEIVLPAGARMGIHIRATAACANAVRFGVKFVAGGTVEETLLSPYTYTGGSAEWQYHNFSGSGEIEEMYVQWEMGTNCNIAGTYTLVINEIRLEDVP